MNTKNGLLIEGYLEYISANKNLSKNTIQSYKDDLLEFSRFMKNNEIKFYILSYFLNAYIL